LSAKAKRRIVETASAKSQKGSLRRPKAPLRLTASGPLLLEGAGLGRPGLSATPESGQRLSDMGARASSG